jgi:hypothetical protein
VILDLLNLAAAMPVPDPSPVPLPVSLTNEPNWAEIGTFVTGVLATLGTFGAVLYAGRAFGKQRDALEKEMGYRKLLRYDDALMRAFDVSIESVKVSSAFAGPDGDMESGYLELTIVNQSGSRMVDAHIATSHKMSNLTVSGDTPRFQLGVDGRQVNLDSVPAGARWSFQFTVADEQGKDSWDATDDPAAEIQWDDRFRATWKLDTRGGYPELVGEFPMPADPMEIQRPPYH